MFKNFFRKIRATLKNSPEAIALAAGFATGLPFFGNANPMVQMATKFLPNLLTAQYQKNPLMSFLTNQALTQGASKVAGTDFAQQFLNPNAVSADGATNMGTRMSTMDAMDAANQGGGQFTDPIESSLDYGKKIQGLQALNQQTDDATGGRFKMTDIFTGLYDKDGLTGKGKLLGSIASTLGPGLATYLALVGDTPEDPAAAKEYRSAVDDYYSAKARGENPNPADYGLSPTPAEDMLKGLRYNTATGQYENVAASRGGMAMGGVAGMFDDAPPIDARSELMDVLNIRDMANMDRKVDPGLVSVPMSGISNEVKQVNTGGVIGLALGGLEKRGMVYGPGGPKDDKIPAMLSNGEFVFTAKAVDNAGGPNAMYNLMNKLDPESSKGPTV
tara:strand:+ start:2535 stop:3698 length:1164 start_codon:yes stop_codon:yes gene_type:complete